MSRQVLSGKPKHQHIFNYLIETVAYSSSKREKNNPVIWLKPVVGRRCSSPKQLHRQPLASPLPRPGTPRDGQHRGGHGAAVAAPEGAPAPLGCCPGGHGGMHGHGPGLSHRGLLGDQSPASSWASMGPPLMLWPLSLPSPGPLRACLIGHTLPSALGTVA